MPSSLRCILSCEHGGNLIPPEYADLFVGHETLLATHRGYDIGILPLARQLARTLNAPLIDAQVSRLLVDLNRSPHSRTLFSEISSALAPPRRAEALQCHYHPYRNRVSTEVQNLVESGHRVVHVSVHSFTPELRGEVRNAEIGLLYDPQRSLERDFCRRWKQALRPLEPALRVRFNYPYRGASDSLVRTLRRRFDADRYLGLELEVNQALSLGDNHRWTLVREALALSLASALGADGQDGPDFTTGS